MVSIIVPVFRNEATIEPLVERLNGLADQLPRLEVVFVVDGSPDGSYKRLHDSLVSCQFDSQLIRLSRNFGSFAAIRHGLSQATGEYFLVMAADLQEPSELMLEFFAELRSDEVDLVLGTRSERQDPWATRMTSGLFWSAYRFLVQPVMPAGGVDVFGCNRAVRDAVLAMDESNTSLVAQLLWLGFRRKEVSYRRQPREHGKSAWTFVKRWRYMTDSVYSFTNLPILLITLTGVFGCAVSAAIGLAVFVAWSMGQIPVVGYTPIMLAIMFSTFMLQASIGVVGNYVWRAFENSKRRPAAVSLSHDHFNGAQTELFSNEHVPA